MATNAGEDGFEKLPRLVSSNHLDGTPVLSRDGDKIGSVAAFLIDRYSGHADYLIAAMGKTLGLGGSYHPIPWAFVRFDPAREGYVVALDRDVLKGGPSFKAGSEPVFDGTYAERVTRYYAHDAPGGAA